MLKPYKLSGIAGESTLIIDYRNSKQNCKSAAGAFNIDFGGLVEATIEKITIILKFLRKHR